MVDKPKPKFQLSNAFYNDFTPINNLLQKSATSRYFGMHKKKMDIVTFFHRHVTHRVVARETSESKEIVGYAEFSSYPKIDALGMDSWMYWLRFHYCASDLISETNVLFFNYFIFEPKFMPRLLHDIMEEIFFRENKVRFLITVQPPTLSTRRKMLNSHYIEPDYCCLSLISQMLYPHVFSPGVCENTQKLHIMVRDQAIEKMRYRKALPEDNDDLISVIDRDLPELREQLGDYYIAEKLLHEEDNRNVFIVTEVYNSTMGFIWLNDNIDLMKLNKSYELESSGNLIKFNHKENFKEMRIYVAILKKKRESILFPVKNIFDEIKSTYSRQNSIDETNKSKQSIEVTSKYFTNRKLFFYFFEKLDKLLRNREHYFTLVRKTTRIFYNVPNDHDENDHEEFPLELFNNAFTLQLFGLLEGFDTRRVFRFLLAAFSQYPNYDYCLLSIPSYVKKTHTLREILKYMIRVNSRPGNLINENLYLTHRSAICGDLCLFNVTKDDVHKIEYMLYKNLKHYRRPTFGSVIYTELFVETNPIDDKFEEDIICEILSDVLHNKSSNYQFLTIRCGNSAKPAEENVIVGFVIVRKFWHLSLLRENFVLPRDNEAVYYNRSELIVLKLHPLYQFQSQMVFRELSRLTGFYDFYYMEPIMSNRKALTNDLVSYMQPIQPRTLKKCTFSNRLENKVERRQTFTNFGKVDILTDNFAVYQHNLHRVKNFGNHERIVVIGFSIIAKAFLRSIIFLWDQAHISTNYSTAFCCVPRLDVTVITAPGIIEAEYDGYFTCSFCSDPNDCWVNFNNNSSFIRDTTKRLNLKNWIHFVEGEVEEIDRESERVILDNGCIVHYEKLLLLGDTKFGPPRPFSRRDIIPPNYVHVNTRLDKIILYHKLEVLRRQKDMKIKMNIVIYGVHVPVFECINFLITHGIPADWILLVIPFKPEILQMQSLLNNPYADLKIESILIEMCKDLGITIQERLNFSHFIRYKMNENIHRTSFLTFPNKEEILYRTDLFISFQENHMPTKFLHMVRDAGIVTENRSIIIDEKLFTSDPNILAFGNYVIHRKLVNHQYLYVCPFEVGEKLITSLNLRPRDENQCKLNADQCTDIKFSVPTLYRAQLPLGYYLVKVCSPKRFLAFHLSNEYSVCLVTYNKENFCRVRLDDNIIVEITVVTRHLIANSLDFLQYYCGYHQDLLNNLCERYYLNEINDFLDFFQEPWGELLMHDYFGNLRRENEDDILKTAIGFFQVEMKIMERNAHFHKKMETMGVNKVLEYSLLNFLRKYRRDFVNKFALPEDFLKIHESI